MGTSSGVKEKYSVPRDSIWPSFDKNLLHPKSDSLVLPRLISHFELDPNFICYCIAFSRR